MTGPTAALPEVLAGRVAWVFPDDFDVDEIIGVQNIRTFDAEVLQCGVHEGPGPHVRDDRGSW